MAAVLSTNAAIKRLNLDKCGIRDAGVEARRLFLLQRRALAVKGPGVGPKIAWSRNLELGRLLLRLVGRFLEVVA